MAVPAYAIPGATRGTWVPRVWNPVLRRSRFGDVVLVVFLLAQCFDGVLTYIGVGAYGVAIEANPIIATLMASFGHGPALAGAKGIASALGICLHLRQVHGAVALLAGFYVVVAIFPWVMILFF